MCFGYLEHVTHFLHVSFHYPVQHFLEYFLVGQLLIIPYLGGKFAFIVEFTDVRVIYFIILGLTVVDIDDEVVAMDERVGQLVLDFIHIVVQLARLVLTVGLSEVELMVGLVTIDQQVLVQLMLLELQFLGGEQHRHPVVTDTLGNETLYLLIVMHGHLLAEEEFLVVVPLFDLTDVPLLLDEVLDLLAIHEGVDESVGRLHEVVVLEHARQSAPVLVDELAPPVYPVSLPYPLVHVPVRPPEPPVVLLQTTLYVARVLTLVLVNRDALSAPVIL